MKNYDTVIFDLDGTLLDTLDDLADSVNETLAVHGYPKRTRDEIRQFVGNGVARLMALSVPEGTDENELRDCLGDFKERYSRNMRCRTAPYEGIPILLNRLKGEGLRLAVVSNKFDAAVKELCLDYYGDLLDVAIGESNETARKPAPDTVIKALAALHSIPENAVYVGDSEVDAATAKNAGVIFIGVTWGFRGRDVLEQAGADYIIDKPEELLDFLELD